MPADYDKLFSQIRPQEPPAGLLDAVMNRIRAEKTAAPAKTMLVLFSFGLAASLTAVVFSFRWLLSGAASSGFAQFFSLLFSDSKMVLTYWQNYLLTLLESLPVFSLAAFLAALLAVLEFFKYLARETKKIFFPLHHTNHA